MRLRPSQRCRPQNNLRFASAFIRPNVEFVAAALSARNAASSASGCDCTNVCANFDSFSSRSSFTS